jgi:hypothetical protein
MNLTTEDIFKLLDKCKEVRLEYFKLDTLQIQFPPIPASIKAPVAEFQPQPIPEKLAEELVKPMSVLDEMSSEEILYYATPYYDELQAQKEAHAQKLAEEQDR